MKLGGCNPDSELVAVYLRFASGQVVVDRAANLGNVRKFCEKYFDRLIVAEVKLQRRGRPLKIWFKAARSWNCFSSGYLNDSTPVGFEMAETFHTYKL